jgi:hypothetical protein
MIVVGGMENGTFVAVQFSILQWPSFQSLVAKKNAWRLDAKVV